MTIDRPFTRDQPRVLTGAPRATATADDLSALALGSCRCRRRGVPLQLVVTTAALDSQVQVPRLVEDVQAHGRRDDNSADDSCIGRRHHLAWSASPWHASSAILLEDCHSCRRSLACTSKWNKCAMGACADATTRFAKFDQWKIHVADIENCEYWISTEGGSSRTTNANPPVCYNYGKCVPITTDATTVAEAQRRPPAHRARRGVLRLNDVRLTAAQDPADGNRNAEFNTDVEPGDIVRLLVNGTSDPTAWRDVRVSRVLSNVELLSDYSAADVCSSASPCNYRVLKCAAGRRLGDDHGSGAAPIAGGRAAPTPRSARPSTSSRTCRTRSTRFTRRGRTSTARSTPGAAGSACLRWCSRSSSRTTTSSPTTATTIASPVRER